MSVEQRVFDEALKLIRKQGEGSYTIEIESDEISCSYDSNGKHCAFAPCLKLDLLHKTTSLMGMPLKDKNATSLLTSHPKVIQEWAKNCSPNLAQDVQDAHDDACESSRKYGEDEDGDFMSDFEENMRGVAKEHGLQYSAV